MSETAGDGIADAVDSAGDQPKGENGMIDSEVVDAAADEAQPDGTAPSKSGRPRRAVSDSSIKHRLRKTRKMVNLAYEDLYWEPKPKKKKKKRKGREYDDDLYGEGKKRRRTGGTKQVNLGEFEQAVRASKGKSKAEESVLREAEMIIDLIKAASDADTFEMMKEEKDDGDEEYEEEVTEAEETVKEEKQQKEDDDDEDEPPMTAEAIEQAESAALTLQTAAAKLKSFGYSGLTRGWVINAVLSDVVAELKKPKTQEEFIRKGGLDSLARWIQPINGRLPQLRICREVLLLLVQFRCAFIDPDDVSSNILRYVKTMSVHPESTIDIKQLANTVLDRWRDFVFDTKGMEDDEEIQTEHYFKGEERRGRSQLDIKELKRATTSQIELDNDDDSKLFAMIPQPHKFSGFTRRPTNVERNSKNAAIVQVSRARTQMLRKASQRINQRNR